MSQQGKLAEEGEINVSKPVYVAHCSLSGGWWAIKIIGIDGLHVKGANTQARRLDQVDNLAREVVSILLDVPEDSFDIQLDVEFPDDVSAEVVRTRTLREAADRAQHEASRAASQAAIALVKRQGLTIREAGRVLGLSHQRVDQLLSRGGGA